MLIFFIILIILFDQVLKFWVSHQLSYGQGISFIPGVMDLTYVTNEGGAWSLFSGQVNLLAIISIFVIGYLFYLMHQPKTTKLQQYVFGLIIGGAIGNLIDRLLLGHVIDIFELTLFSFPVFNIADAAVCIGMFLLMLQIIFDPEI